MCEVFSRSFVRNPESVRIILISSFKFRFRMGADPGVVHWLLEKPVSKAGDKTDVTSSRVACSVWNASSKMLMMTLFGVNHRRCGTPPKSCWLTMKWGWGLPQVSCFRSSMKYNYVTKIARVVLELFPRCVIESCVVRYNELLVCLCPCKAAYLYC